MAERIKVGVNGAAGRMGRRIVALAIEDAEMDLTAAIEYAGCPHLGKDAGELAGAGTIGVPLTAELGERVDVIIDFSLPDGLVSVAHICSERGIPLVAATTGLTEEQSEQVSSVAHTAALLLAPIGQAEGNWWHRANWTSPSYLRKP